MPSILNIIRVVQRMEGSVNIINFTHTIPIHPNRFFQLLLTTFKSKLCQKIQERGPFDIRVSYIWGCMENKDNNDDVDEIELIGDMYIAHRCAITNVQSMDECYSTSIRKIREKWNSLQVNENNIKYLEISVEIMEIYDW